MLIFSNDPFRPQTQLLVKAGTALTDASKNGYSLSPSSNVILSTDVPFGSEKSMDGTASKGRIVVSTSGVNFNPGAGDFTAEAFVKLPLNHSDTQTMVFSRAFSGYNYLVLSVNNSGTLDFWAGHQTAGYARVNGVGSVAANTWTHLAWVRYGNTCTAYINGVSVGTASASSVNLNNANTQNPGIGGYTHDVYGMLNGKVFNARLTFWARYTGNFQVPITAFPAY